jgi:5-methylcytosine-specific restriction protein A
VQVSEMQRGHKTQLEHLQCLCANCHRLVHREMRAKKERVKRRET